MELTLDGTPHRESGLGPLARSPSDIPGGTGPLLGVLVVRSGGTRVAPQVALRVPTIRLGRDEHNGVVIPHASVSSEHAELRLRGGVWTLADLGSLNGSWVDGEPVLGSLPLAPGSEIRLGEVVFAFGPRDRWEDSRVADSSARSLERGLGFDDDAGTDAAASGNVTTRAPFALSFGVDEAPASFRPGALWIVIGVAVFSVVVFLLLRAR